MEEDFYNSDPDYVHDAALDWYYEHADEYNKSELEDGDPIMDCEEALMIEGYDVDDPACHMAIQEAYDDFLADEERPIYPENLR